LSCQADAPAQRVAQSEGVVTGAGGAEDGLIARASATPEPAQRNGI
jgi:hypothetical protein